MNVIKKNDIIMTKISDFFVNNKNIDYLIHILKDSGQGRCKSNNNLINNKIQISLRIIDWFVTNYSKKNNIYWIVNNDRFSVFQNYKSQLKAYSKKFFDPFCRRERINFYYNKTDFIITTIGQLNFFKWAIKNDIINYINDNYKKIEMDMHDSLKKNYFNINKKRRELSISCIKKINKNYNKTILQFN